MGAERTEPQQIELRMTTKLNAETLAEKIVGAVGTDEDGFIFELLDALDTEVGEWDFSLRLVRHVLKLAQQYVDDTYTEAMTEHVQLTSMVGELSDALRRELRIYHGIDEK